MLSKLLHTYLRKLTAAQLLCYVNDFPADTGFGYQTYVSRLDTVRKLKLDTPDFIDLAFKDHPRSAVLLFPEQLTEKHIQCLVDSHSDLTKFVANRLSIKQVEHLFNIKSFFVHKHLNGHPYYQTLLSKRGDFI